MANKRPLITIIGKGYDEPETREMNDEEYERHLAFLASIEEAEAQEAAKALAREAAIAKLAALGLTPEDLAAL